ncbi:MAG: GntR family transcriptional regulator [Chthoniobacterales bacterium]
MLHLVRAFLPFRIEIKSGEPISDQVVYAVEKAILTGMLKPGARFPSVRAISQDLRIHPNTTQKAITVLVDKGFLEVQPGIGTTIAKTLPIANRSMRDLHSDMERLVLQAMQMRVRRDEFQQILEQQWNKLSKE